MAGGNTIARGSVLITTDADPMHKGLATAGKDVEKWGKETGGKAGKETGSSFLGGFKKGALAVGAAFVGVGALANEFSDLSESIDKTSKQAAALDIGTEALVGWQHAAELSGVNADELALSFQFLRKNTEGPLEDALMRVARDFEAAGDAGDKNRILVEAFGRSGQKLAPLFASGAKGIEEMKEEAKALGITFDEETGKQIEASNDAITKVKTAFKGAIQTVLVGIAPAIEKIADFATSFFKFIRPAIDWASRAWSQYQELVLLVWDEIGSAISDAWEWVQLQVGDLFDWTSDLPSIQEVIVAVFRATGIAAALAWDTIKSGAGVVSYVAGTVVKGFGVVVNVFKEVVTLAEALPEDLRPKGIDEFIKGVKDFEEGVFNTSDKLQNWGKNAMQGWGKSAEQFNSWLDRALNKAKEIKDTKPLSDLAPDVKKDPLKLSGAIMQGSKEAYSLVIRNQFRDLFAKDEKDKEQKKTNRKLDRTNKNLEDIDDKLGELGAF